MSERSPLQAAVNPSPTHAKKIRFNNIKKWVLHPGFVTASVFVSVFVILVVVKPPMVMKEEKRNFGAITLWSVVVSAICLGLTLYFQ